MCTLKYSAGEWISSPLTLRSVVTECLRNHRVGRLWNLRPWVVMDRASIGLRLLAP